MKIKVIIPILFLLTVLCAGLFFGINQLIQEKVAQEIIKVDSVNRMTREIMDLRDLTYGYLYNPTEQVRAQWWIQHDKINRLLSPVSFMHDNERVILISLLEQQELIESVFLKLVRNVPDSVIFKNYILVNEQKTQLTNQILLISYEMLSSVIVLDELVKQGEIDLLKLNSLLNNGFLLLLFIIIIILAIYVVLKIVLPIDRLFHATDIIIGGNLDYKVGMKTNDELGQLSRSFDKMTESFKKSQEKINVYANKARNIVNEIVPILQKISVGNFSQNIKIPKRQDEFSELMIVLNHTVSDLRGLTGELEKKKIEDEAILSSIGDAVMACDKNGKIILFNHVASKLSGFTIKEAVGQHYNKILAFVNEDTNKLIDDFIVEAINNIKSIAVNNHIMIVGKEGFKIPVIYSAAPVLSLSGKVSGCVVVFHDVTQERRVDRAKTEFVSLASHQLRTPLTGINWLTELFISGKFGKLTNKQKEGIEMVHKSGRRMSDLVSALLNLSRLELGTFSINSEPVEMIKIIDEVLSELGSQIEVKNITIIKEFSDKVSLINADSILLKIIWQNLLTNAIRYTLPNKSIIIKISKDNKNFLLTVCDSGVGIPKEEQSQIFSKLFRASNAQKMECDGTGLGLYLTKSIIDTSGGKIWFDSVLDKGSTFYVTIPLEGMKSKEGQKALSI